MSLRGTKIAIMFIVLSLNSCFTSSQNSEKTDDETVDNYDDNYDDDNSSDATEDKDIQDEKVTNDTVDDGDSFFIVINGLPHPKKANSWNSKALIQNYAQPDLEKINICKETILALAEESMSLISLKGNKKQIIDEAKHNRRLFHWCFYQMVVRLDELLAVRGDIIDNRVDLFLSNMKGLWLLGAALDYKNNEKVYFKFLRKRYLNISKSVFGRDLDIIIANPALIK